MLTKISTQAVGVICFFVVLLFMPLGHTLMILNEKVFMANKLTSAFILGGCGVVLLFLGLIQNKRAAISTLLGFVSAVLIWTGWVEFSFVWVAERLNVPALTEHGEVVTKPEYLIMVSSLGVLSCIMLYFLFTQTKCQFFVWFQKFFRMEGYIKINANVVKPVAMTAFIETIMIIWLFYIVLLLLYDKSLIGEQHPLTYVAAFGSFAWSLYLFSNLLTIKKFDYAIRYAVPTVVIFWNFVEIMGRWNLLKEIWIYPFEHWVENTIILSILLFFIGYYFYKNPRPNA